MADWQKIDGFLTEEDAIAIAPYIQGVGENGWIIEVGCFKGRQSLFIADHKKDSVLLSCIDPFPDNFINYDDSRTYKNYMFYNWQENIKTAKNVEAVRSISPFNISYLSFSKIPDLIILDVDSVFNTLLFWSRYVDSRTVFLVHTYRHEHDRIASQLEVAKKEIGFAVSYKNSLAVLKRENQPK